MTICVILKKHSNCLITYYGDIFEKNILLELLNGEIIGLFYFGDSNRYQHEYIELFFVVVLNNVYIKKIAANNRLFMCNVLIE